MNLARPPAAASAMNNTSVEPTNNLWSSILDSVSGTRGEVTKNVVVLGNHKSGKSTIVSQLASVNGGVGPEAGSSSEVLGVGLSYSCLDVGEESDDDTAVRLGVYQLPSSLPPYPALLPLALSRSTLLDSLVVIVLDWDRPWLFLRELRGWIGVLEGVLEKQGEGWEGAEGRERLETHLRCYAEPSTTSNTGSAATSTLSTAAPSASQLIDMETPLAPGVLTTNLGIGIVIVCTKADQIDVLEKDQDYNEEHFDYVQQTLRTIALRYGAALLFTSHSRPTSFSKLRSYILHRLFSPSPLSIAAPLPNPIIPQAITSPLSIPSAPVPAPAVSTSRAFPFSYRANVVDRDEILVPSGWDSWGKIKILRERYDPEAFGRGWENDLNRSRGSNRANGQEMEDGLAELSAVRMYENFVIDLETASRPIHAQDELIEAQDESTFLQSHYDALQKDREKDPRNAFASRSGSNGFSDGAALSALGPMGADRDSSDEMTARLAKLVRKDSATGNAVSPTLSSTTSPPLGSAVSPILSTSSSALLNTATGSAGAGAGAIGAGSSNEVLANFFQSLLAARTTPSGSRSPGGVQDLEGAKPSSLNGRSSGNE